MTAEPPANANLVSLDLGPILAIAGQSADRFQDVWDRLWAQRHIPPRLLDLCRLKLAKMHQAPDELTRRHPAALRDGLSDAEAAAILSAEGADSPLFSASDRAVLNFCEFYGIDPQSITDDYADAVKAHFGEPGLVALVEALGCIDGRIRLALVYQSLRTH